MRWLLPTVRRGGTITYGRVAERLARELKLTGPIFPVQIGHVAGTLADHLLEYDPNIPLLNVLVVDKSGKPGPGIDGYLRERYGSWRAPARRAEICARAAREVYEYGYWDQVYADVFGADPPGDPDIRLREGDGKSTDGRSGGGPESPEHKKLKLFVRDNPTAIGLSAGAVGKEEFLLLSGDQMDVLFLEQTGTTVVEVKSTRSGYYDFQRGIYQCVKYRAVMDAQLEGVSGNKSVRSILVTEAPLPGDLEALARRLKIVTRRLKVN